MTKLKITYLASLMMLLLAVAPTVFRQANIQAEPIKEPLPDELLSEFLIVGKTEGIGNFFEIKDSQYLDITLRSSEEIKIFLESILKMISMDISPSTDFTSTNLTLEGLEPNKTYYKYQDSYKNGAVFISDENGLYNWHQDLNQSHHIWIQEEKGTTSINEDTVLDHDITGSVEITSDNITLDCDGHSITGSGTGYGIYLHGKNNITIKNCTITYFSRGIYLGSSNSNVLNNNIVSNNESGIFLGGSDENNLTNNNTSSNNIGIYFTNSHDNTLAANTANLNNYGIHFNYSNSNILNGNITSENSNGIWFFASQDNTFNSNSILNNNYGIHLYASGNTTMILLLKIP